MAVMQMDSQLGQLCDEQGGPLISLIFAIAQGAKKQTSHNTQHKKIDTRLAKRDL
jgi:hypothetical protein